MNKPNVSETVKVINTYCIGIKIIDNSYDAVVTKVNAKSFIAGGKKFTFKKELSDGKSLYKNDFGHIVKI